jgi:hypothetical protein
MSVMDEFCITRGFHWYFGAQHDFESLTYLPFLMYAKCWNIAARLPKAVKRENGLLFSFHLAFVRLAKYCLRAGNTCIVLAQ